MALVLLLVAPAMFPVLWDRFDYIRIHGRLVDATTGEALPGITVLMLGQPDQFADAERLRYVRVSEKELPGVNGIAMTDTRGAFNARTSIGYGGTSYPIVGSPTPYTPPPFHGARALQVIWPDASWLVLDTTSSTYTVVDDCDIYAVIDMDVVKIDPGDAEPSR